MILLFSLLSSFPFRKIGIACFTKCLTKCFKNLTYKPKLLGHWLKHKHLISKRIFCIKSFIFLIPCFSLFFSKQILPKVDTEDFQAFAFKSIDPHFTRSFSSTIRFVYLVTLLVRLIGSDSPRPRRISARWIE